MSNVFISHSSLDKPFVRRLAAGLLAEGFPVWLDSWSLELGDSLLDGVYDGIEGSGVVLLIVSKASVDSGWVNRELNAALAREQQLGRKFLLPVKVDNTPVPLKVADRLYADFSSAFSAPLSALSGVLSRMGCHDMAFPEERELVCLTFTDGIHLDSASFAKAAQRIRNRRGHFRLTAQQIVTNNDDRYDALLQRLHSRVDSVASDPYYSPGLEEALRNDLEAVRESEHRISRGAIMLLAHDCPVESVFWFCSLLKARNAYTLWSAQLPGSPETFGKDWYCGYLRGEEAACKFFGIARVERVQVWDEANATSSSIFSLWIDASEVRGVRDSDGVYIGASTVGAACVNAPRSKFILPQMLIEHFSIGTGPMIWELEGAMIGIA